MDSNHNSNLLLSKWDMIVYMLDLLTAMTQCVFTDQVIIMNIYFSRIRTEAMLKAAREDQVKNKEHFLAVQAARDRTEFERVLA